MRKTCLETTCVKFFQPMLIFISLEQFFNFCRVPIIIYSVLSTFKVNLLATIHWWILFKSEFKMACKLLILSEHAVKFVSSAYISALECLRQFGRSLTYKRNNNGPRFEPCGTPQRIFFVEDAALPTLQNCFRSNKHDWNKPLEGSILNHKFLTS